MPIVNRSSIMPDMHTFAIETLGCKVNQYESQQIRELLERLGLNAAAPGCPPDLVVVNTCCVTHVASAKSRQQARKSRHAYPHATVVVTGCLPSTHTETPQESSDHLYLVRDRCDLPGVLHSLVRASQGPSCYEHPDVPIVTGSNKPEKGGEIKEKTEGVPAWNAWAEPIRRFSGQSRAFLKVQDGCDGACTYCIIPRIRTKVCNKPVKTVLAEAAQLVAAGHPEIVLTGICLGAYGQDTVRHKRWARDRTGAFADLVDQVARVPGLQRLRLSSLGPGDVTDPLLSVLANHANIMPHLHLPLQSGSDAVLRRMARQYRLAEYLKTVERVRATLDRPAITTDIIVGFPQETDADFEQTLNVARQVRFSKIHVFAFSPRKGTPAAEFRPRVPPSVIRERSRVLRELDEQLQAAFRRQFIGERVAAVLECRRPPGGRTERYFAVSTEDLDEWRLHDSTLLTGILRG